MKEVGVVFEILDYGIRAPIGWSKVTGHLVLDAKIDFTRKSIWFLDRNRTPNPVG